MKIWIVNSLDERYGSTYRIRAFAKELTKLSYDVTYYEKKKSFILKWLELARLSLISDYHVLIIQKFNPLTFIPILIARLRQKCVIVDWDDWDTGLQKNILLKMTTWLCETTLPHFPNLITSHNSYLLEHAPITKKTLILEQGFDEDLFRFRKLDSRDSDKIRVGYMCTFTHGGTQDLDDILVQLARVNNLHIQFVIIGGGKLLETFRERAKKLLIHNIVFTDYIPHLEIPSMLQTLDVGLIYMKDSKSNQSRSSFKTIEYLAAEVPVLGNLVGETHRLFSNHIIACPLENLPDYLNRLQPSNLPEKKSNAGLLKEFLWSKIILKLHQYLQGLTTCN